MKSIKVGDVFEIETNRGKGYFQLVEIDKSNGDLIKVFYELHSNTPDKFSNLIESDEYYFIRFPTKPALRRKLIKRVDNLDPNPFKVPRYTRSKRKVKDETGWYIVDTKTMNRTFVGVLSEEQKKLSPSGIVNDTWIIDRFNEGWNLENW